MPGVVQKSDADLSLVSNGSTLVDSLRRHDYTSIHDALLLAIVPEPSHRAIRWPFSYSIFTTLGFYCNF